MQIYQIPLDQSKKEITQHGRIDFPLVFYTTQISKNVLGFIDWHWHQELQFCLVTNGQVEFHVNQDTIVLSKGEGIFINSKQLHQAKNYQNIDSSYLCLDFHPKLLTSFSGSIINTKYITPYIDNNNIQYCRLNNNIPWQNKILTLIKEIYHQDSNDQLSILINLYQIWQLLYNSYLIQLDHNTVNNPNVTIRQIIDFISDNYQNDINLTQIASNVNLSKGYCCKLFKSSMGCTIFEYLINYRLLQATSLLLNSDNSITEIAYLCGFNSSSYFIKHFKAKTKMSPNQYRKINHY